jgi:hypothetical protein
VGAGVEGDGLFLVHLSGDANGGDANAEAGFAAEPGKRCG